MMMIYPFKKIKQLKRKIEIYECEKVNTIKYIRQLERENAENQCILYGKNRQIRELRTSRDRLKKQVEDMNREFWGGKE